MENHHSHHLLLKSLTIELFVFKGCCMLEQCNEMASQGINQLSKVHLVINFEQMGIVQLISLTMVWKK